MITLSVGEFVLGDEVAGVNRGVDGEQIFRVVQVAPSEGVEQSVA